jgi:hypothetical protein
VIRKKMKEENSTKKALKPITAIMTVVVVIVSVLAAMPLSVSANPNQILAADGAFGFKDFFGEDEIVYATGDIDATLGDLWGIPVADLYVVDHAPSWGETLVDVSGHPPPAPNTITSWMIGGQFFDEIVWLPLLQRGIFYLVIDENQNGKFDNSSGHGGGIVRDAVSSPFRVGEPVGVTIDVTAIKNDAEDRYNNWNGMATKWDLIGHSAAAISAAWSISTGDVLSLVVTGVSWAAGLIGIDIPTDYNSAVLTVGGKVIKGIASVQAAHWDSLHADPPDPAFTEFATIDIEAINSELAAELAPHGIVATYPFTPKGDTSYEAAQMALANDLALQAALVSAVQSSLEKYQGADTAGNDDYTYLQARSVKKFSDSLLANFDDTKTALNDYKTELTNEGLGNCNYQVSDIIAFQDHLRDFGLTAEQRTELKELGMSDAEIDGWISWTIAHDVPADDFTMSGVIEDLITGIDGSIPAFLDLSNQAQAVMDDLEPFIEKHHPVAVPGGPYTGDEGAPITFDGSGSSDPDSDLLTYVWDFDLDGDFDDGAGAIVTRTWDSEFSGLIGLKVTDTTGLSDNAFTTVTVSSVNDPPIIDSFAPAELEPTASQSSPLDFSVTAHDPDADPLSYSWTLEGAEVSTGTAWTYTPGAGESGQRVVRITVSDDNPLSRDTFERRLVEVLSEVENQPPVADPNGLYIGTEGVAIAFNAAGLMTQTAT